MTLAESVREVGSQVRSWLPDRKKAPARPDPEMAKFIAAGEDVAAERRAARDSVSSWAPIDTSDERARVRKLGRVVLWCVVGLLVFIGLRSMLSSSDRTPAAAPSAKPTAGASFPTGQAQAVAQRWAKNYLTFNGQNDQATQARKQALAQDTSTGIDLDRAWNSAGVQSVSALLPGQVTASSDTAATVTVYAQVSDTDPAASPSSSPSPSSTSSAPKASSKPKATKKAAKKETKKSAADLSTAQVVPAGLGSDDNTAASPSASAGSDWIGLTIPVGWDGHRVVVTGLPAFVGLPQPGDATQDQGKLPQSDSSLSAKTRTTAETFFRAYAGSDAGALQAVAAPGASLAPLGGQVQLGTVQSWTVYAGSGTAARKSRSAQAVVIWRAGDAQLTQAYDVRLVNVTGGAASEWRVESVSVNTHATSQ